MAWLLFGIELQIYLKVIRGRPVLNIDCFLSKLPVAFQQSVAGHFDEYFVEFEFRFDFDVAHSEGSDFFNKVSVKYFLVRLLIDQQQCHQIYVFELESMHFIVDCAGEHAGSVVKFEDQVLIRKFASDHLQTILNQVRRRNIIH